MKYFFPCLAVCLLAACRSDSESSSSAETAAESSPSVPGFEEVDGMIRIPGGTAMLGHEGEILGDSGPKQFPEEGPASAISVDTFWIDKTEVTNAEFAEFVAATSYQTFAERSVKAEDFPAAARASLPAEEFSNGSIVFVPQSGTQGDPNTPGKYLNWWRWDPEANWRAPMGKGSDIEGKDSHPVVCITYEDASAYAKWANKRLPTEAEWEFAARGGLDGATYTWGEEKKPDDRWLANIWQGEFPNNNSGEDGHVFTAPVASFPANGYGLHDMAGNVWELCADLYDPAYFAVRESSNPQGPKVWVNRDTGERGTGLIHRVTKGGSFLCHESYCLRYRPAARHSQDTESPTNHTGFRCARSVEPES